MTHEDTLLGVLADGRWHDHYSLYRLGLMVHSRVAVLRKRGHVIECRRVGKHYEYRLDVLGAAVPAAIVGNDDGTAAPSTLTERDKAKMRLRRMRPEKRVVDAPASTTPPRSVSVPGQLSIDEAA